MRPRCWWLGCEGLGAWNNHWICQRCGEELYGCPGWHDGAWRPIRWRLEAVIARAIGCLGAVGRRIGLCSNCGLHRGTWIEETGMFGFLCAGCAEEARRAGYEELPF